MRVAHFVHRYPPALGGAEAYFARLGRWLAASGDEVTVFTTDALDLEAMHAPAGRRTPSGTTREDGVEVRRYPLWRMTGRRWLLKPLSLWPHRTWQALTLPCNPISLRMWADTGRAAERFDMVHATAFPYAFPIACARRLARRLGAPFVLTPFLHLGDPNNPRDRTRRQYTRPALWSWRARPTACSCRRRANGWRWWSAACGRSDWCCRAWGWTGIPAPAATGGGRGRRGPSGRTTW